MMEWGRFKCAVLTDRLTLNPSSASSTSSTHTYKYTQSQIQGQFQEPFRQQCPETARLLHELHRQSSLMAGTPFSFAFFSTLHPGAEIAPHSAPANLRIRCHLPLIVPPFPPRDEPDPHASSSSQSHQSQSQSQSPEGGGGASGGGDYETMEDAKAAVPCGMRIGDQIRCVHAVCGCVRV